MLKFIKMKYHGVYLLYYSVLFVFIVVFTVIENSSANWSQSWKKLRIAQVCTFFLFEIFDQHRWKLGQESHALASNQVDFGTAF